MPNPIKELRQHLKLTQVQFAAKIGTKQGTVAGWEAGNHCPTESSIILISSTFGANPNFLRTGEGPMMIDPRLVYGERIGRILALPDDDLLRQAMLDLIDVPESKLPALIDYMRYLQSLESK